jgi:ribosome-interacting GTPase 1
MVLDATKRAEQRALLEAELEAVGIRLNREPPWVNSIINHTKMRTECLTGTYT